MQDSWEQLINDADQIADESVSGPSKQIYQSRINVYVETLTKSFFSTLSENDLTKFKRLNKH